MIEKIDLNLDILRLEEELATLLERMPLKQNEICLMHTLDGFDPYYAGVGSLTLEGDFTRGLQTRKENPKEEKDFYVFNEELEGTYFEDVYLLISEQFQIARMRIIVLNQKQCLTWHADRVNRLHIPIVTDEAVKFVVEDTVFHAPADGNAYLIETTKHHTVFNGSRIIRTHLVAGII